MSTLPREWTTDRLKDISIINGSSLPPNTDPDFAFDYLEISNVNYHGVVDPNAIERLRYEDAPSRARRRVQKGNTLVSSVRPNLQAVAFIDDRLSALVCSTGFNVVQPLESKLRSRFAYYSLVSEAARQYFEATAKGVGYPAVDDKDFDSLDIPLPPLQEQERISVFLDLSCAAIDAAIAAKRLQVQALDTVRSSVIEVAVTQGPRPRARRVQVNRDWIASLPEHWAATRIKRIVSRVDYGISVSTEPVGKYPVLKMGNIQAGEIVFAKMGYVNEVEANLVLEKNDLLYNRTNSPDQVGKAALFRGTGEDGITFASYLVRLRVSHRVIAEFLNYVVNCAGFLAFARKLAIQSVQQSNLNATRYCQLFVPLPPLDEQHVICEHLEARLGELRRVVATIEAQMETLLAYRKSLIYECVTGQRRVTEADLNRAQAHG